MIVVVAASQAELRAPLAPHFGRCHYFVLVDSETHEWRALPNPATTSPDSAGTRAAQFVADQGVEVVISEDFGPNAVAVLKRAGIRMCLAPAGPAAAAVDACLRGRLAEIYTASWETHPHAPGRRGERS